MGRPQFKIQHIAPPGIDGAPKNVPEKPDLELRGQMIAAAKAGLLRAPEGERKMTLLLPEHGEMVIEWELHGTTGLLVYWLIGGAAAAATLFLTGNDDDDLAISSLLGRLEGTLMGNLVPQYRELINATLHPFAITFHFHRATYDNVIVGEWSWAIAIGFYDSLGLDGSDPVEPAP